MNKETLNNIHIPYPSDIELEKEIDWIHYKIKRPKTMMMIIFKYLIRLIILIILVRIVFGFMN